MKHHQRPRLSTPSAVAAAATSPWSTSTDAAVGGGLVVVVVALGLFGLSFALAGLSCLVDAATLACCFLGAIARMISLYLAATAEQLESKSILGVNDKTL